MTTAQVFTFELTRDKIKMEVKKLRFRLGITGRGRLPRGLYTTEGQNLLARLCNGPVSADEVPSRLSDPFQKIGALRLENDHCYLNFPCFLQKDRALLNAKGAEFGASLAAKIQGQTAGQFPEFKHGKIDLEKYLFFIIGCVCLDWRGLKILRGLGLIPGHHEQNRGKYGNYTLYGNEDCPGNFKELYWGSHNFKVGKYIFTTFGDHVQIRMAFPDLLFKGFSTEELVDILPPENHLRRKLMDSLFLRRLFFLQQMLAVGRGLTKQKIPRGTTSHVLKKLNYLDGEDFNIPIVTAEDMTSVGKLVIEVERIIEEWIKENSATFKKSFKELTPIRLGVDFKEVLIQIWHYVFGHANKTLSRSNYFFNPYGKSSPFPGYLPIIHEAKCGLFKSSEL